MPSSYYVVRLSFPRCNWQSGIVTSEQPRLIAASVGPPQPFDGSDEWDVTGPRAATCPFLFLAALNLGGRRDRLPTSSNVARSLARLLVRFHCFFLVDPFYLLWLLH